MMDLARLLQLKDPALTTRWFVRVANLEGGEELIAETIELSFPGFSPETRVAHGSERHYPGRMTVEPAAITFYETYDYLTTKALDRWRKLVRNPDTGAYGMPAVYKKVIYAYLYGLENNSHMLTAIMEGCWPTTQQAMSLQYDDDTGRQKIPVSFSVDRFTLKY